MSFPPETCELLLLCATKISIITTKWIVEGKKWVRIGCAHKRWCNARRSIYGSVARKNTKKLTQVPYECRDDVFRIHAFRWGHKICDVPAFNRICMYMQFGHAVAHHNMNWKLCDAVSRSLMQLQVIICIREGKKTAVERMIRIWQLKLSVNCSAIHSKCWLAAKFQQAAFIVSTNKAYLCLTSKVCATFWCDCEFFESKFNLMPVYLSCYYVY